MIEWLLFNPTQAIFLLISWREQVIFNGMMMLFWFFCPKIQWINCISGIMVSMLTLNAVDCGFEPRSGQTENFEIGIWCFSSKYAALRSNNWLASNQENVSDRDDMSICRLLFQWTSTIKIQRKHVGLVQSGPHHYFIEN